MKPIAPHRDQPKITIRHERFASGGFVVAVAAVLWLANISPAKAQAEAAAPSTGTGAESPDNTPAESAAPSTGTGAGSPAKAQAEAPAPSAGTDAGSSQTDIFSKNTISLLVDTRLFVASGSKSFVNGGLGKSRFEGDENGDFTAGFLPVEADVVWQPRFTGALSANVSGAYQRSQTNSFDLIEAFLRYLPKQTGPVGVSARVGLMWPEISLEHSTGGAWTVVNTITPSAINSWVGEEVKVVGAEVTIQASLGQHEFAFTGAVFGLNDTSGTLLSYRGWSLSDLKATGFGYFPLPPLNPFITLLQQDKTRSTIDIDHRAGFYGRIDWRPPWPFGLALFYYDNMGNPQAFTSAGQWGWRTRFWNLGLNADLGPNTRLLAQGMTGSTQTGFQEHGVTWVDTSFDSAYLLVTQKVGPFALTGRIEAFSTHEHGSEMPGDNSENGWAMTAAVRMKFNNYLTGLIEAMNIRSSRGTRVGLGGLTSPFEAQTVIQAALRLKL